VELLVIIFIVDGVGDRLIAGFAVPSAGPESGAVGSNTNGIESV